MVEVEGLDPSSSCMVVVGLVGAVAVILVGIGDSVDLVLVGTSSSHLVLGPLEVVAFPVVAEGVVDAAAVLVRDGDHLVEVVVVDWVGPYHHLGKWEDLVLQWMKLDLVHLEGVDLVDHLPWEVGVVVVMEAFLPDLPAQTVLEGEVEVGVGSNQVRTWG